MDIVLFRSYCDCVSGCLIGITAFITFMYLFSYIIRKAFLDDCFKDDKK